MKSCGRHDGPRDNRGQPASFPGNIRNIITLRPRVLDFKPVRGLWNALAVMPCVPQNPQRDVFLVDIILASRQVPSLISQSSAYQEFGQRPQRQAVDAWTVGSIYRQPFWRITIVLESQKGWHHQTPGTSQASWTQYSSSRLCFARP